MQADLDWGTAIRRRLRRRTAAAPAAVRRRRSAVEAAAAGAAADAWARSAGTGTRRSSCRRTIRATLYLGANHLFKSTDRGDTWRIISPDLTKNDREEDDPQVGRPDAGRGSRRRRRVSTARSSRSPNRRVEPGNIWVGTDDGNVQVTRNDGGTWTNVSAEPPGPAVEGSLGQPRRGVASHARHGVRHGRRPRDGDLQAVRLQDHRLRQDLDEHLGNLPARIRST